MEIRENNKATNNMVKDYGVTVIQMPQEDYPVFTAAAEKIWTDMAEEYKNDAEAMQILKLITDYLHAQGYTDFEMD